MHTLVNNKQTITITVVKVTNNFTCQAGHEGDVFHPLLQHQMTLVGAFVQQSLQYVPVKQQNYTKPWSIKEISSTKSKLGIELMSSIFSTVNLNQQKHMHKSKE